MNENKLKHLHMLLDKAAGMGTGEEEEIYLIAGQIYGALTGKPQPPIAAVVEAYADDMRKHYVALRQGLREALFPVWPNNPGNDDNEIIEATSTAVKELVGKRKQ